MIFNNDATWFQENRSSSIDDNLSFEEEMLRQAELRLNKVHSHKDGSPVSLKLMESDNQEDSFNDITKHVTHSVNSGGEYGNAMVAVNFECGCGGSFSLNNGEFTDLSTGTTFDATKPSNSYMNKSSSDSGYSSQNNSGAYGSQSVNY